MRANSVPRPSACFSAGRSLALDSRVALGPLLALMTRPRALELVTPAGGTLDDALPSFPSTEKLETNVGLPSGESGRGEKRRGTLMVLQGRRSWLRRRTTSLKVA